ncbi:MAG: PAS domain S-box protein [Thermodesulfovibrio sp.]|nr:PAS domain S-box protein [Thermodesulfovibrio sp.]
MRELKALYELIHLLGISEETNVLLERLIFHVTELMNAQSAVLRLIKDEKLYVAATYNLQSFKPEININEGLCGRVIQEGKVKIFNKDDLQNEEVDIPAYSAICLPLVIKKTDTYTTEQIDVEAQIIGTILVYNKINSEEGMGEFTEDDIRLGELFSSIASLIILKSMQYKEINELKSYLESLIQSSADAIVATDLNNVVTAWNKGAEIIFGYKKEEVIGKPLPVIPDFLMEVEKFYIEKIKQGEILKDIETVRITKDHRLIEISLTLSPIKNISGEIVGISRIGRDITERKKLERELIRRNEELTKILFVSSVVRSTLSLNTLLRMILTVITMGEGLGFNRAVLFLLDEENNTLRGKMAVGPSNYEEAWQIWSSLSKSKKSLYEVLEELSKKELEEDSFFDRLCKNLSIPLDINNTPIVKAVKEKKVFNIQDVHKEEADPIIIQQLGSFAYAIVPLISKGKSIGAIWVDNLYTRKPITDQDINFLKGFADQVAGAIENAWIFEKVEQAEKEMEMLFDSITDLLYYTDEYYSIKKVNKAFLKKIGKEEKDVINKKCFQIIHRTEHPLRNCPHRQAIDNKKEKIAEIEEDYLDGTYLVSSSPIFDKDGNLRGTINLARDITEIRDLREKIASMEKMAALGEMAAKVAHEIRNPLLAIGGFAKRLNKELKDEKLKEYVKVIVDETRRLERILNETLSFVRPQPSSKIPFNVKELISDIANLTESTLKDNNRLLIEADEEIIILGSYDKLKEVLLNMVTNANEATKNGTITIRTKKLRESIKEESVTDEYCIIEIEDTGSGISKENLKKIFNPFFTTKINGTGLGLAISKKIIDEHGGIIKVESEENKGTIFKIYLPIYKEGGKSNENNGSR